jgi:hypothetical protein
MRNRLIETGVIDSNFLFTRDYLFTSPSTAASIVRGASSNGRTQWKNQNDLTLAMVEAMEISE